MHSLKRWVGLIVLVSVSIWSEPFKNLLFIVLVCFHYVSVGAGEHCGSTDSHRRVRKHSGGCDHSNTRHSEILRSQGSVSVALAISHALRFRI